MAFDAHVNFAYGQVTAAPNTPTAGLSLSATIAGGASWPAVPFNVTVYPAGQSPLQNNAEILRVTAVSSNTLTIVRAQEGTSARTILVGDQISANITAKTLVDVENLTSELPDITVSAAPATLTAGRNNQITTTGTFTAPTPTATLTVPPQRFAITNRNAASTITLSFPNSAGTTVNLTVLAGEVITFRQVTVSGYANESGNKPLAQLDARYLLKTGDDTKTGSLTLDGTNGSRELYLKSSFNGGDDDGANGHYDSTSRLHLESYQRAGTNNEGEVAHIDGMMWNSKQMFAWRFPDSYDGTTFAANGAVNDKVWMGAHALATGNDLNHNHWEIETNDTKGLKRGRFTINFAPTTVSDGAASSKDPNSVGIGLDKTYVATNQADFIVRTSYPTFQTGDTTVPTGPQLASASRLVGPPGIAQDFQFSRDFYGSIRRWAYRNSADPEAFVITINGAPTGGTFTVTVNGNTSAAIPYNETAANVQTAINNITGVSSGATVTGSAGGPYTVVFAVNTGGWNKTVTVSGAGLTGGTSPSATIAGANSGANMQLIAYGDDGTTLGTAINIDRLTGLMTLGATSTYRGGGILINKSNTGNAFKIVNSFAGGTAYFADMADTASRVISADVIADAIQRYVLYADGKQEWGSGAATRDTNLYRGAAGVLRTDYQMKAVQGFDTSAANIVTDTTTGSQIATSVTQKLGFFGTAPVVQPTNTSELITSLYSLGLRASGTAVPITTSGAVTLNGQTSLGSGGLRSPAATRSAAATLTSTSAYLNICNATTAAFAVTLPAANAVNGQLFYFLKSDSSTNAITITAAGTDKINGAATYVLASQYKYVEIFNDNSSNWFIKANN